MLGETEPEEIIRNILATESTKSSPSNENELSDFVSMLDDYIVKDSTESFLLQYGANIAWSFNFR